MLTSPFGVWNFAYNKNTNITPCWYQEYKKKMYKKQRRDCHALHSWFLNAEKFIIFWFTGFMTVG